MPGEHSVERLGPCLLQEHGGPDQLSQRREPALRQGLRRLLPQTQGTTRLKNIFFSSAGFELLAAGIGQVSTCSFLSYSCGVEYPTKDARQSKYRPIYHLIYFICIFHNHIYNIHIINILPNILLLYSPLSSFLFLFKLPSLCTV